MCPGWGGVPEKKRARPPAWRPSIVVEHVRHDRRNRFVIPSHRSGGPWQAEDLRGDEGLNEVVVDWCYLKRPGFADLSLNVVLIDEPVAAVGVQGRMSGGPTGLGGKVFGHVGFGPTR